MREIIKKLYSTKKSCRKKNNKDRTYQNGLTQKEHYYGYWHDKDRRYNDIFEEKLTL